MNARPGSLSALILSIALLVGCESEGAPANGPTPSTPTETAVAEPEAVAAVEVAVAAPPEPATGVPSAEHEADPTAEVDTEEVPTLPVPASWRTTRPEMRVGHHTVHSVSSACELIPTFRIIEAVVASTESCTERAETELHAIFERGRVTAIRTSGPDAQCVEAWAQQAHADASCQIRFTFSD